MCCGVCIGEGSGSGLRLHVDEADVVRQPLLTNYNQGNHHTHKPNNATTTHAGRGEGRWVAAFSAVDSVLTLHGSRVEVGYVCALCPLGDGHVALDMSNVDEDAPLPFSTPRHVARVLAGKRHTRGHGAEGCVKRVGEGCGKMGGKCSRF